MTVDTATELQSYIELQNQRLLEAYTVLKSLIREHYGIEQTVMAGGYGYRQIIELVQNGADAILEAHESGLAVPSRSRVQVLLRGSRLYVANTGAPLSQDGVEALLSSHSSPKRGNQIGRFGLGFKSLLALGGTIDLFTRSSGAIRLDPHRCRRMLRQRFEVENAPGLRLAWPLEDCERVDDRELAGLGWAETVVRVGVESEETLQHLRQEIRSFPAEFLLFFPVPVELVLDDGEEPARELGVQPDGERLVLQDGRETSRWLVARREVRVVDPKALADATHMHARDSVPVAWAVPVEGRREEAGRFWAFFPTHTPTFLRGILNAPWKLNSDRNAIIGGEWNRALMSEAAALVAETMPSLRTDEDPALPLDAFPRQLDRRDDDAAPLVESLWKAIETAPVIPDATGTLRPAAVLLRHPRESEELASQWQALTAPMSAASLVHPKCHDRLRSARLDALARRLAERPDEQAVRNLRRCSVESWFAVVASSDAARAVEVLALARAFAEDCKPVEWAGVRNRLQIVPDTAGALRTPPQVMLAPEGTKVAGLSVVDARLQADLAACSVLTAVLGVRPLGDEIWDDLLRERLHAVPRQPPAAADIGWRAFWETLRESPAGVRAGFILAHRARIRLRRADGSWTVPDDALLPGGIVAQDDQSASGLMLVDMGMHASDLDALGRLGVRAVPEGSVGPGSYDSVVGRSAVLGDWLEHCRRLYKSTHANSATLGYLEPGSISMPASFRLLPKLEGVANARLSRHYLARLSKGEFQARLRFGHSTVSVYPKIEVEHPLAWFLLRHGCLEIGGHVVRLSAVADRRDSPVWADVSDWRDALQPAIESLGAAVPAVPSTAAERRKLWLAMIDALARPESITDPSLSRLWGDAAADEVVPSALPGISGLVLLADIFVTTSIDLARRVRLTGRVAVTLDEKTLDAWLKHGARNLAEFVKPEWTVAAGPVSPLSSLLPELAEALDPAQVRAARGQAVSGLRLRLADDAEPVPCLMWNETLLLDLEQLAALSRSDRLRVMLDEASAAGLLRMPISEALDLLANRRVDEFRAVVGSAATLPERLLLAVGGRREPLIAALGAAGQLEVVQACSDRQLAGLVLSHLGPAVLVALRDDLDSEGLRPPSRWSGQEARAFVAAIGFPDSFASSPEARRDAEEMVTGPIELPPLHDFQREVLEGVKSLLASGNARRRAVVSLPTGGGKTRVTVEAAVRLILAPEGRLRSVIWVAQTDELCEQAVQAFRQVWLNVGAARTGLRIVRLWGGNPNPAPQDQGRPVAIVASIQTLNSRFSAQELAWLRRPGLVVVDECHHAITPSYTNLLRWLDAEAARPGAPVREEPPMLGLSATPFRTDDDESSRLARRFDGRWLPHDQEALYQRLRAQGVLAEPVYEGLQSGTALLPDEADRLARLPVSWEGLDFENLLEAINQRLAGDAKRNERLVQYLQGCGEQSILFFANSVSHAHEMAIRLNVAGVPAAAVSGASPSSARREFLDRFQQGDVRVLCNHSVLTTGFDAPKTDMVLIARQVFSPVHYMQMVGRGLRGEANGGTARCRVVTVLDNLGRFQDRHPYHYCRRYFEAQVAETR
ncbi:MAG: DEAD/DEAH box helicase [Rhodoferax sp.]|nr:DEAD/DEAH box helicase [Rhodoferax sp.]